MSGRIPIESLAEAAKESERVLLGLCLLEPQHFSEIELAVDGFGISSHREIYTALIALQASVEDWDAYTFSDHLRAKGKLEAVGGAPYISDLTTGIPLRTAIDSHIQRVRAVTRHPEIVLLSEVKAREVEWLWPGYLPVGMLCMLSGESGRGKDVYRTCNRCGAL
jgi:hypothetical protein